MSEPKNTGNAADELAQHETGADFESVNRSPAPPDVPAIKVHGEYVSAMDLLLRQDIRFPNPSNAPGELQEGAKEQMAAQIFDDPTMITPRGKIEKRSERGALVWWAIRPKTAAAMWGDRVLIKRDTMESAYSCRNCKGKGHYDLPCPTCKGKCEEITNGEVRACRSCQCLGYDREVKRACGFVLCESCAGSGWAGGIVKPEITQEAPVAGIVVSIGPQCVDLKLGDRVLHSKYAGHTVNTPEGESYTTMHEHEVLWLLRDLK